MFQRISAASDYDPSFDRDTHLQSAGVKDLILLSQYKLFPFHFHYLAAQKS